MSESVIRFPGRYKSRDDIPSRRYFDDAPTPYIHLDMARAWHRQITNELHRIEWQKRRPPTAENLTVTIATHQYEELLRYALKGIEMELRS